jgi:exopolysaccharide production protein ExoQ
MASLVTFSPAQTSKRASTQTRSEPTRELSEQLSLVVGSLAIIYMMTSTFDGFAGVSQLVLIPTRQLAVSGMLLMGVIGLAPRATWTKTRVGLPIVLFLFHQVGLYWLSSAPGLWRSTALPDIVLIVTTVCVAATMPLRAITRAMLSSVYLMSLMCWVWIVFRRDIAKGASSLANSPLDAVGWRGTFEHKNLMSMYMVVGVALIILFEHKRYRWVTVIPPVGLVLIAQSSTAVVALAGVIAMMGVRLVRPRLPKGAGTAGGLFGLIAAVGLIGQTSRFLDLFYGALGKDSTLSSRTLIWSASWRAIKERPWNGWGPGAAWQLVNQEPSISLLREIQFPVYHAHSGLFELMLGSGAIGLGVYLVLLVWAFYLAGRLVNRNDDFGWFFLMALVTVTLCAVSEPVIRKGWLAVITLLASVALVRLRELGVADKLNRTTSRIPHQTRSTRRTSDAVSRAATD